VRARCKDNRAKDAIVPYDHRIREDAFIRVSSDEEAFMICLRSITKVYGEGTASVRALDGVDLDIESGEFVSIMGPSGSGKSTMLNLLAALDLPTSGQMHLAGRDVATLDDDALTLFRRRTVGLVFQFFNLLPTLNVLDNVLLPVMMERRPRTSDRARAHELLDDVGMGARKHHRTHELSGGEMQRVAIARALVLDPPLLLADEPTGNLDSVTAGVILRLLREARDRRGTTVVMVTHDEHAAKTGDRLVTLRDGRLARDTVLRRPPSPQVAE
jgi:putative ABC transport system ATP-binding protein